MIQKRPANLHRWLAFYSGAIEGTRPPPWQAASLIRDEFDEQLWLAIINRVMVDADGRMIFRLKKQHGNNSLNHGPPQVAVLLQKLNC